MFGLLCCSAPEYTHSPFACACADIYTHVHMHSNPSYIHLQSEYQYIYQFPSGTSEVSLVWEALISYHSSHSVGELCLISLAGPLDDVDLPKPSVQLWWCVFIFLFCLGQRRKLEHLSLQTSDFFSASRAASSNPFYASNQQHTRTRVCWWDKERVSRPPITMKHIKAAEERPVHVKWLVWWNIKDRGGLSSHPDLITLNALYLVGTSQRL